MTDQEKDDEGGLAQLARLRPPEWIVEMQRHYRRHGVFRAEDVARVLGRGMEPDGSLAQAARPSAIQLLQQIASKRK